MRCDLEGQASCPQLTTALHSSRAISGMLSGRLTIAPVLFTRSSVPPAPVPRLHAPNSSFLFVDDNRAHPVANLLPGNGSWRDARAGYWFEGVSQMRVEIFTSVVGPHQPLGTVVPLPQPIACKRRGLLSIFAKCHMPIGAESLVHRQEQYQEPVAKELPYHVLHVG